ncbi:MAG TPA: hypothetical protein VF008_28435 [Niastella sp.]
MSIIPVQIQPGNVPLSKEQQAFNRLVKRIEKLQKQIPDETSKLEQLNSLYNGEVFPNVLELGRLKIQMCHLLHKKRQEIKLSATQNQKLDDLLLDFLDDAFSVIEPDETTKELYAKYSNSSYAEELSLQESDVKKEFCDMLYNRFGLKLDPSLLSENPDFGKIEEELKKQWEQKESGKRSKHKTKKQQENEKLEQQKEVLKNKSIRSIYVALAKILHPDTEPDEALKIEKEEMMKMVTVAYEKRDLMQLLQLEMQWIKKHDESLHKLEISTLNAYIHLLKDQVKELEAELEMLFLNPAFSPVVVYRHQSIQIAILEIKREGRSYIELNKKIQTDIHQLEHGTKTYAPVVQCIRNYYTERGRDFSDEDMMDLY